MRKSSIAVTGFVVAAVAGVTIGGAAMAGTGKSNQDLPAADQPAVAQNGFVPSQVDQAAAPPKAVAKSKYAFQNKPQVVGKLPANGSVEVGTDVTFRTRGTQWALVSHLPGEEPYEPFGWRATIGNDNIGDGTSPGIQSMGSGKGVLANSVFKNQKVATVVYTRGKKAWYAKIYRLGGIPGWVESNAVVSPESGPRQVTAGKSVTKVTGPLPDQLAVFAYDASGKLLKQFPDNAENPLPK